MTEEEDYFYKIADKSPNAMNKWFENKRKDFDALSEHQK
jgi:hypothetical protein